MPWICSIPFRAVAAGAAPTGTRFPDFDKRTPREIPDRVTGNIACRRALPSLISLFHPLSSGDGDSEPFTD